MFGFLDSDKEFRLQQEIATLKSNWSYSELVLRAHNRKSLKNSYIRFLLTNPSMHDIQEYLIGKEVQPYHFLFRELSVRQLKNQLEVY